VRVVSAGGVPVSPGRGSPGIAGLDSLQVIGTFEHSLSVRARFADSDHDGVNEIVLAAGTPETGSICRVLEHVAYGQYVHVFDGPNMTLLATGDADQDGRSEFVGLASGGRLRVYEAPDTFSHPSLTVWESAPLSTQVGVAEIADTDADGQLEIVYLFSTGDMRLAIFECKGDNSYVQRFLGAVGKAREDGSADGIHNAWAGDDLLWDLDLDGRPEIANASGFDRRMQVFESTSDDVWEKIFEDSTGLRNGRVVSGGVDSDGDGIREMFIGGENPDTGERRIIIYQPTGDRSFERVAEFGAFDGVLGEQWGTMARTEPGGPYRFYWALYRQLRVCIATAPGNWTLETVIPDPNEFWHSSVYAHDLNRNGRDEIYWLTINRFLTSLVLERPTFPTDASGDQSAMRASVRVAPSPCRGDATVFLDPTVAARAAEWSLFDAAGRLVLHRPLDRHNSRSGWLLPADRLRPGLYFLRVRDAGGRPLATGRATVVR